MSVAFQNLRVGRFNIRRFPIKAINFKLHTMTELINKVPDVIIDDRGTFKYILVKVYDEVNSKLIVRGYARSELHADIYNELGRELKALKPTVEVESECCGGGRIEHDPVQKKLRIFGYSQGYGRAEHKVTASILIKKYPDYFIICSDES